ncbi:MAG: hypothetical protein ABI880_02550 [Acidobacteriota bacterium]
MTARPSTSSTRARRPLEWRLQPVWERVLVAVFLAVLVVPGLATLAGVDAGVTRGENRDLAPAPVLAAAGAAMAALPAAFTAYFQDHFAFRGRLVRWQAALRLQALRGSPSPTVIRGRDGWLFYADDGALDDYLNQVPFSAADLDTWATTLQHTSDWMTARGITYLFVIAPDKHVMYPEYLPASIHPTAGPSRTDQLVAHLRAHTTVPVLDLRPALFAAKNEARLYHRTDSHWNDLGAAVATRAILNRLDRLAHGSLPGLAAPPDSAYARRDVRAPGRDLARMLGLEAWLTEDEPILRLRDGTARVVAPAQPDPNFDEGRLVSEKAGADLPRAVVYRDSFGSALVPFLAEHFSRALFLWEYDVDPALIAQEHPRVVIQEWAGRRFATRLPYDPFAASAAAPVAPPVSSSDGARR